MLRDVQHGQSRTDPGIVETPHDQGSAERASGTAPEHDERAVSDRGLNAPRVEGPDRGVDEATQPRRPNERTSPREVAKLKAAPITSKSGMLTLPVDAFYFSQGRHEFAPPSVNPSCVIWKESSWDGATDVGQRRSSSTRSSQEKLRTAGLSEVFEVADKIMQRLFEIKLSVTYHELPSPKAQASDPENDPWISRSRLKVRARGKDVLQRFEALVGAPVDLSRTSIAFVGSLWDLADRPVGGFTSGIEGSARDYELGGTLIHIAYLHERGKDSLDPKGKGESVRAEICDFLGGLPPRVDKLGIVIAHELGHSLHLRHIEDDVKERASWALNAAHEVPKNLMKRDVETDVNSDKPVPGLPKTSADFELRPAQKERARKYGLCMGRFLDCPSPLAKSADYGKKTSATNCRPPSRRECEQLLEELELGIDLVAPYLRQSARGR